MQEYTMSASHRIPQSGHLTALEMAKLYVSLNFADPVVGIQVIKGNGGFFHHHVYKRSGTQYPIKTKSFT
jgi:hypothetical protein